MHAEKSLSLEQQINQHLLSKISIPQSHHPSLIIVLGPCRTATGALATTLGRSENVKTVHIQPLKAFARAFLQEKQGTKLTTPLTFLKNSLEISSGNHAEIIKDTFGPTADNPAEWINPLKILLQKGFPADKITLVPTARDLLDTISSMQIMWNWQTSNFPIDGFNKSFTETAATIDFAREKGINVVPYVHELIKNHSPNQVIQSMCQQIGIPFNPNMTIWDNEDAYWTKTIKYDQPPKRWIKGALGKKSGGRGQFIWEPIKPLRGNPDFFSSQIHPAQQAHQQILTKAHLVLNL